MLCVTLMPALESNRWNLVFITSIGSFPWRIVCSCCITSLLRPGSAKLPSSNVLNCAQSFPGQRSACPFQSLIKVSFHTLVMPEVINDRA